MKKDRDQDQIPLLEEDSPKQTWLFGGGSSRSTTSFLKLPSLLHAQIPRTPQTIIAAMYEEDMSYLHNLLEAEKMDFFQKLHSTPTRRLLYSPLLMLVRMMSWPLEILPRRGILGKESVRLWNINLSSFRRKCEAFQKKVSRAKIFLEKWRFMAPLLLWLPKLSKLESSLEAENKHQINTSISGPEMKSCTDEALKALHQEKESCTKIVKFMMSKWLSWGRISMSPSNKL